METLVLCTMGLFLLCFILKLSLLTQRQIGILLLLSALFVGLAWPWAVEQSRTQIEAWLANPELMRDTSVLLSFDLAFLFAYCVYQVTGRPHKRSKRMLHTALVWYPGMSIALVLFSVLVLSIFSLPGTDFALTAWGLALALLPVLGGSVWLVRWLLPETDLRLELLFLLAILLSLMGVIVTVHGGSSIAPQEDIDWLSHAAVLVLLLAFVFLGYGLQRLRLA